MSQKRRHHVRDLWIGKRIQRHEKPSLRPLLESIKSAVGLLWSSLGAISLSVLLLAAILQLRRDLILIDEFSVPEELAKQGWTGRAISKELLDQLYHIQFVATTRMKRLPFSSSWSSLSPDIVVAGTSVPLSTLTHHLQELIGKDTKRVDGEVLLELQKIQLAVRITRQPGRLFSAKVDEQGQAKAVENLLSLAAQYVYEMNEPFILASFLCTTEDGRCIPMIEHCLRNAAREDDPWAYNLWGLMLTKKKKYAEAEEKFGQALALNPDFDLAYTNWGELLLQQDKFEQAAAKFQQVVTLRPSAESYANWGLALLAAERYQQAFEKLQSALELDSRYVNAYVGLGVYHESRKDLSKALSSFRKALLIDPSFDLGYQYLAEALDRTGNPESKREATRLRREMFRRRESALRKNIDFNPNSGMAHYRLASLLVEERRYQEAMAKYEEAIRTEDAPAEAFNGLGEVLLRYRRYGEAIEMFRKATELDEDLSAAQGNWGYALDQLERYKEALSHFQEAVVREPDSAKARRNWGACLYKLGRYQDALSQFREAKRLDPNSEHVLRDGCVVARKVRSAEAIKEFCEPDPKKSAMTL